MSAVRQETPAFVPGEECCDRCGVRALEWRRCKLICANCRTIIKSCADL